jgi:hypothetical protein
MTTNTNHTDRLPCEGCEGSSGQQPVTTKGFCPACEAAAISRHGETQGRFYVGYRSLNITEAEHYEAMEAVYIGAAHELYRCPVDDSLQGVMFTRVVGPTNSNAFDGGEVITLRCGHVIV